MNADRRVTEERSVPPFHSVIFKAVGTIQLKQGTPQSVHVEAPVRALPRILTEVKRGTLSVTMKKWAIFYMSNVTLHITMEDIRCLLISGAGTIECSEPLRVDCLELTVSGAGKFKLHLDTENLNSLLSGVGYIELFGKTGFHNVMLSGAGCIDSSELVAKKGSVHSSGVGTCTVNVSDELDVHMSGVGKVLFRGKPRLKQHITGLGRLEAID